MKLLRPVQGTTYGPQKTLIFKKYPLQDQVFVLKEGPKQPLRQPYDGRCRMIMGRLSRIETSNRDSPLIHLLNFSCFLACRF